MSDLTITTRPDGTGTITGEAISQNVAAPSLPHAREQLLQLAASEAQRVGRELSLVAHDDGQTFHLIIGTDGITRPAPSDTPTLAPAPPAVPQPEPAAPAVVPPPPGPVHSPAPAQASPAPGADFINSAPSTAPAVQGEDLADPVGPAIEEDDPEWQQIASQPATEGRAGALNRSLSLSLKPSEEELVHRRTELQQRRAREEAARRAEEDAQHARDREALVQASRREQRRRETEARRQEQREVIQTNFQGTRTILIANPKGGARKTTSTYVLGATMGIIRGGSVIAWDANETMGTLGDRSKADLHDRTVVDLLQDAADAFSTVQGSRLGALDAFVRPQGDAHFDVLASDEDPTRQDIVDAVGFQTVHEILSRFYRMIFIDTGNNIRVQHFLAAVEAADQLVIPVAASRDSARVARQMMRSLIASGHETLVSNAVVLLHELEAPTDGDQHHREVMGTVAAEFEGRVAAIIPIPFDAALKDGDTIEYTVLSPATRGAYQEAAAAIATSMRNQLGKDGTH